MEEKLALGFRCVKLKIGAIDFEEELSLIRSLRERFDRQTVELRVDAKRCFPPRQRDGKTCRTRSVRHPQH